MLTFLLWSALLGPAHATNHTTPTKLLAVKDYPDFVDDINYQGMDLVIQRQLAHFNNINMSGTITMGGKKYPLSKVKSSLETFAKLIKSYTGSALKDQIKANFNVFVPDLKKGDPRYGQAKDSFFTGYATQPVTGKGKPDSLYKHAIYALPHAKKDQSLTRDQIDFHGALDGKGLELVYAANLFDLYELQIEGGGYVTQIDATGAKTNYYLNFDATNNQPLQFISKYMLAKGYITNPSLGAQRKFLRMHPEKEEEIFSQNKSYVFYKVTTTPPGGSEGVSLTPGRSIATDHTLYAFKGVLAFVSSQRPVDDGVYDLEQEDVTKIPFQPFSRFFLDQDTGGAITGKGRADLYMGVDEYAQYTASYEAQEGNIFFLLLK